MSPLLKSVWQVVRRFGIAAGTGIIACIITGWPEWAKGALVADEKTAYLWPIIWGLVEFAQKYLRERKA